MKDLVYDLAIQFRKAKLWTKLEETNLFAIQLPDGEIGYCCVMGQMGEHYALSVNMGQRGLTALRNIVFPDESMISPEQLFFVQDCLQCCFENAADMEEDELKAARDYAKRAGVTFRGKKSFPSFARYTPYHLPTDISTETEQDIIETALRAALHISECLKIRTKDDIGFSFRIEEGTQIPFLVADHDTFKIETHRLPASFREEYPKPYLEDEISAMRIKKAAKKGIWQCHVYRMDTPVQLRENEDYCIPMAFITVDTASSHQFPVYMVDEYEEQAGRFLKRLAEMMLEQEVFPKTIQVKDERTQALLEHFCSQTGIQLKRNKKLPALDETMMLLDEQMHSQETDMLEQLFEMIRQLDAKMIDALPKEIKDLLVQMYFMDDLPDDLEEKIAEVLEKK